MLFIIKKEAHKLRETGHCQSTGGKVSICRAKSAGDEMMSENDFEPAHTLNLSTPSKIKCDSNRPVHAYPAKALQVMKKAQQNDNIQFISLDPFTIFYCSVLQQKWYSSEFKKEGGTISIDAT